MIAHIPATASRTSRRSAGPDQRESRALGWAIRLARIGLAIYLIPVLLVMLLVGGIGVVVLGLAEGLAKLAALARSALGTRDGEFPH